MGWASQEASQEVPQQRVGRGVSQCVWDAGDAVGQTRTSGGQRIPWEPRWHGRECRWRGVHGSGDHVPSLIRRRGYLASILCCRHASAQHRQHCRRGLTAVEPVSITHGPQGQPGEGSPRPASSAATPNVESQQQWARGKHGSRIRVAVGLLCSAFGQCEQACDTAAGSARCRRREPLRHSRG
jgi:hypothetical protein